MMLSQWMGIRTIGILLLLTLLFPGTNVRGQKHSTGDPCLPSAFLFSECIQSLDDGLSEIDFSGRRISGLPHAAFAKFSGLFILDLSSNLLRSLSQGIFSGLTELKTLKLNNNLIEKLIGPPAVWLTFIQPLQEIHLSGNRFICDCELTWLVTLLATDDIIQDAATVQCFGPPALSHLLMRNMPPHYVEMLCNQPRVDYCGTPGMFPCTISVDRSLASCIPHQKLCNGVPDCEVSGNDENPFICNTLRHAPILNPMQHPNNFLQLNNMFNALARPPLFVSPAPPPPGLHCRKGTFACWSGSQCVPWSLVCNGKPDCGDGADEDVSLCQAAIAPKPADSSTTIYTSTTTSAPTTPVLTRSTIDLTIIESFLAEIRANSTLNWLTKYDPFSPPSTEDTTTSRDPITDTPLTPPPPTAGIAAVRLIDLPSQKIESAIEMDVPPGESTGQGTHATITFPQLSEPAYVNHFQGGFRVLDPSTHVTEPVTVEETSLPSSLSSMPDNGILEKKTMRTQELGTSSRAGHHTDEGLGISSDNLKPQRIRLVNLLHNEISVSWHAPVWPADWDLVAYNVGCEIENNETGHKVRKKKSPLLSPLVHEYVFHHILPDDSLKVIVTATYRDKEQKTHECSSEPVFRKQIVTVIHSGKDALAITSSKHGSNYSGRLSFEDTMGLSVGGSIACLMMLLLGLYLLKRKKSNLGQLQGTNVRALRMRKVDRYAPHIKNDRTLSSEPIYAEPENGYHEIAESILGLAAVLPPRTGYATGNENAGATRPDDGYVEVLESLDSAYYGHMPNGPFSNCSEYSCYSVAASGNHVMVDPRMLPVNPSECSSFAVYSDSDHCSAAYGGYHNSAHPPLERFHPSTTALRGSYTGEQRMSNCNAGVKQFGDTLMQDRRGSSYQAGRGPVVPPGSHKSTMYRPKLGRGISNLPSGSVNLKESLHVSPSTTDS